MKKSCDQQTAGAHRAYERAVPAAVSALFLETRQVQLLHPVWAPSLGRAHKVRRLCEPEAFWIPACKLVQIVVLSIPREEIHVDAGRKFLEPQV